MSERKTPNRLISEKSPYLLQHAHNPVDWYPWEEEAFEKALKEDVPVFLSIGYSTCHWCHVMEKESFEDAEVARLMNDSLISIKVDREERPDIDGIYMTVCQMMTGSGGWPLTIVMTPDKQPFFAATYLPRESRYGRIGMLELIPRIRTLWKDRRADIVKASNEITDALRRETGVVAGDAPDEGLLRLAFDQLSARFDEENGGFGKAPKFPMPHALLFLLRFWERTGEERAREMSERTLLAMRSGGMFDQLGLGFHRYSTDDQWILPHFEKMLYDQAMLSLAYTEAFQAARRDEYRITGEEILSYVLREMTAPEGGFYSAEDADSEGVEGKFYVWRLDEIAEILGPEDSLLFAALFNVREEGNFHEEATKHKTGANVLHLPSPLPEAAHRLGITEEELTSRIGRARKKLFDVRERRVRPGRDDKILTDWNGLMISAFARAARAFGNPAYADAARRAADFILDRMRSPEGLLYHRFREGEAAIPAFLDDYAFFVSGLIDLYEATFDAASLGVALELNADLLERFWDAEQGGFFHTSSGAEDILARRKEIYDAAVPSGNSVAMLNLLRLARITGDAGLEERAVLTARAFSGTVREAPVAYTHFLCAVDYMLGPSHEVVIAGEPGKEDTQAMISALRERYLPRTTVILLPGEDRERVAEIASFAGSYSALGGKATAYVCRNRACELPTIDVEKMLELLKVR